MQTQIRLILTGGGTGGHIMPNLALIEEFRSHNDIKFLYIGGRKSMEKVMSAENNIPFKSIFCGKLRRYFSLKNFIDPIFIFLGFIQSLFFINKFKTDVVFAKGGFVSVPVVLAAKVLGKKIVLHESDLVPGLANRICARFASKILVAYKESADFFKKDVEVVGNPVRKIITNGNKKKGLQITDLTGNKPVLLAMGGSQGAGFINDIIWDNLDLLLSKYEIIHICGKDKSKNRKEIEVILGSEDKHLAKNYISYDFVKEELAHLYAACDLIISRAGAMSLAEIMAVDKPAILIPLSKKVSRGDQIDNALAFANEYNGFVMEEDEFDLVKFLQKCEELLKQKKKSNKKQNAVKSIINILKNL
ncbi:undecaprenyldiphospho-muramoylpentapeptide beta-N-acetylglucosaminyltransferase [Candidatus Peregrinibacteria bacterium]|nr:undecaprenyldiphospho-muramoylpentapeptide beta-N-acetylglucosaminyltransferase [Candidatus Peregrinibacteria bacterium]